jgi:nucleoid DNA-binding protein
MAKNKTTETQNSVAAFLKTIKEEKRRKDFSAIIDLITKQTGLEPKMWGTAIVGFGSYHYKYESGREGDAPLTGIAARANAITLYLGSEFSKREELLSKFGKHKIGGGCIHIQKLEDIDTGILTKMIKNSIAHRKKQHGKG